MKNKDEFSACHPVVNFLFFGIVFIFTMFSSHPFFEGISFVCGVLYLILIKNTKAARFLFSGVVPLMFFAIIINPAFSHEGNTVLFTFPTGNLMTLESLLYGISAAFMLGAVLIWAMCYSSVMSSDKFVYLFGRIVPYLSLLISMTLRFVPLFIKHFREEKQMQTVFGRRGFRLFISCLSATVTRETESAIEKADSMKARGYGLKGRTAFSIYTFTSRDKTVTAWLSFCAFTLITASLTDKLFFRYYPSVRGRLTDPITIFTEIIYLLLCLTPIILDKGAEKKWKSSK